MAIFSPALTSALDHSATFLTVLAGRTVKNSGSPRGPRFEPGRPQPKIHRSIVNLIYKTLNQGWWDGEKPFNWTQVIGEAKQVPSTKLATPKERYTSGQNLLKALTKQGKSFLTFTSQH